MKEVTITSKVVGRGGASATAGGRRTGGGAALSGYVQADTLEEELAKYVSIEKDEAVKGLKEFEKGVTIGGLKLAKTADGVLTIEGNLVVTGGMTMYGLNGVPAGSVFDALPIDGETLIRDANGVLMINPKYKPDTEGGLAELTKEMVVEALGYDPVTQEYVDGRIDAVVAGAPAAYDTLKEIADVLAGNVNSIGDLMTAIATKADKATTLAGYGITDAYTAAKVDELLAKYVKTDALTAELAKYVTTGTAQTVTGAKDFTGGLKVNGAEIGYDKAAKCWTLTGNLVVTGGVTMYGGSGAAAGLMDGLVTDGVNLKVVDGVLTFVGKTGGGTADSVAWDNVTGRPLTLASPYALTIRDSGGAAKVTYDGSSVQSLTLTKAMVGLDKVENTALSAWTGSGKLTTVGTITSGTWQGGKIANGYLANSGVTISGKSVSLGGSLSQADLRSALGLGSNAYTSTEYLAKSAYTAADVLAKLKTVDGSGSGLDADLLNGVPLMGHGGANGILRSWSPGRYTTVNQFFGNGSVVVFDPKPTDDDSLFDNTALVSLGCIPVRSRQIAFDYSSYTIKYRYVINGSNGGVEFKPWRTFAFVDSNVASATKLQTARKLWGQSFDGTGDVSGNIYPGTNGEYIDKFCNIYLSENSYSWSVFRLTEIDALLMVHRSSGNVGIGTASPSAKLHVAGDTRIGGNLVVTGGVTMYSDLRKKTKLGDVELTLREVADAPLIAHYYTGDEGRTKHVGSVAQYWAGLNDWFCKADAEGYLTMEIQNAALASAISVARELVKYESKTDRRIRRLTERVRELEEELNNIKIKKEKGE